MPDSKQRRSGLNTQQSVVSRLVGQAEERQREQETRGRGKPGHGQELGVDQTGRSKATFDLSIDRQMMVDEIAQQEDVAKSDIAEAAIVAFYNAWRAGRVNLEDLKKPARSLRVLWKISVPDEFNPLSSDS